MKTTTKSESQVDFPLQDSVSGNNKPDKTNISVFGQKRGKFSYKGRWTGLILFCLFSIGCSLGVIVYAIKGHPSVFTVMPIPRPVSVPSSLHRFRRSDSLLTKAQYRRIEAFERDLSLQKEGLSTRPLYDSLITARPHLLDSLRIIDSLFLSQ